MEDRDQAPDAIDGPPEEATPHLRADDTSYLAPEPVEAEDGDMLLVPWSGELVDVNDEAACIRTLAHVRELEARIKSVKSDLTDAIVERSRVLGTKTLTLPDGRKGVVGPDTETTYDAESLERDLRAAGMPEDRLRQIVREDVTYTVAAAEAKKAAGANPVYAEIIERHRYQRPKTQYVSLKGFGL